MDNAQALFDRLLANGKQETDKLITDKEAEHHFLDFKAKSDSNGKNKLNPDDDKNFGKALSGFANAQGGVIIWGIDKRKGQPMQYKLIESPELFVESLNQRISEVAIPFVEGVDNRTIFNERGAGVVATYVPMSEKTPHQYIHDKHYYLRIGDSFKPMEHGQLEDMFGRRSRPNLRLDVKAKFFADSKPNPTFTLNISLENIGRAITQLYGFDILFPISMIKPECKVNQRMHTFLKPSATSQFGTLYYRNTEDMDRNPIYPNETVNLTPNNYKLGHIQFELSKNQYNTWKTMEIPYKVYSENMMTKEGSVLFGDLFPDPPLQFEIK